MGKGIAPQIKSLFPEAFKADKLTKRGDIQKLGSCSMAYVEEFDLHVVNAYTQYSFAKSYVSGEVHVDYEAIKNAFSFLNFRFKGGILAIPKIGAGLAGGDWNDISDIINSVTPDITIHVYMLD